MERATGWPVEGAKGHGAPTPRGAYPSSGKATACTYVRGGVSRTPATPVGEGIGGETSEPPICFCGPSFEGCMLSRCRRHY